MSNINSGIYKIVCIVTLDDYLGSAIDLSIRFYRHKYCLKKGTHYNKKLQRDFDKYGPDNFIFEVIEYVQDKNNLIAREQYYIDTLKPTYNVCKIAGSQLGLKRSEESKLKMSKIKKGNKNPFYGKHHTKESICKISEANVGNKNPFYSKHHTEKSILKISESHSKPFKLLSPQGLVIEGINLKRFCKENNLDRGHIYKVINNKYKQHKGWRKV